MTSPEESTVVGNVQQLLVIPPEQPKKFGKKLRKPSPAAEPRLGHLIFDASFESGNLGRVDCISADEFDLFVRPDTCNPKYRLWFHFTVRNVRQNQRVLFNIVNFSKVKSSYQDGMTPVVKTSSRAEWQRLPSEHVDYYRSPSHGNRFILSFAFAFDIQEDVYSFAYSYPYSYSDLQQYLSSLEAKKLPYFRRDLIAVSLQQRRLDLLTITDVSNLSLSGTQRIVFVTARVHPGESPSSFVCQGLIDFLLSSDSQAEQLRKQYVFKIVPMLNPDGVALGNYRTSLMGFDLNRHWQLPSTWAHPTIHATKNLLVQYNKNSHMEMVLYVDLHAHSTRSNCFFYGNVFSADEERCNKQLLLPLLMQNLSPDFSLDSTAFNTDITKTGTSRRTLAGSLSEGCLCYTLEVSFYGYKNEIGPKEASNTLIPYNLKTYQRIGANLVKAIYGCLSIEEGWVEAPPFPRPFATFVTKPPVAASGNILLTPKPRTTRSQLLAAEAKKKKKPKDF